MVINQIVNILELKNEINITDSQLNELEMHSVINILSVISSQLHLIQFETDHPDLITPVINQTLEFADGAREMNQDIFNEQKIVAFKKELLNMLKELNRVQPVLNDDSSVTEYLEIFKEVFQVFDKRAEEMSNLF